MERQLETPQEYTERVRRERDLKRTAEEKRKSAEAAKQRAAQEEIQQTRQGKIHEFQDNVSEDKRPQKIWQGFNKSASELPPEKVSSFKREFRENTKTKVQIEADRKTSLIEKWASEVRNSTQDREHQDLIEMDRRHGREANLKEEEIHKEYIAHRDKKEAEIKAIKERQEKGGFFYSLWGERRDHETLSNLQAEIDNGKMREESARSYNGMSKLKKEKIYKNDTSEKGLLTKEGLNEL